MANRPDARPLSPHLQVYRMSLTMALSIIHRITGAALYFGTLLLAGWVFSVAMGPEAYRIANEIAASIPGRVVLFGFSWALVHHTLGGIRHLVWDTGRGLKVASAQNSARLVVAGSVLTTLAIWAIAYQVRGF
jgi:succinate dehydrogenase / fumarate reductase cytochrome b subunit